jgi:hypothetical protein
MALSNLAVLPAIAVAFAKGKYWSGFGLIIAGIASAAYHLVETEKHDMKGAFGRDVGREWHCTLINIDRVAALTSIAAVLLEADDMTAIMDNSFIIVVALMCLGTSEWNRENKWPYFPTHFMWHTLAFYSAYQILSA